MKIEKDIPIPKNLLNRIKPSMPFDDMHVGDSIYIANVTPKKFRSIRARIHRYQQRNPERMLSMSRVMDTENDYRIFLIKDGEQVAERTGE